MNKLFLFNVLFNFVVAVLFVVLNIWALNAGLEETFVSLALLYGAVMLVGNSLFVRAATIR